MQIERLPFGSFYNQKVNQITLSNDNCMSVSILELGGRITHLLVPNSEGKIADVVLGLDNLNAYTKDPHYFGALIGRVANRIEGAQYEVNSETVMVNGNAYNGKHCVHGGRFGYHHRVWEEVEVIQNDDEIAVTLRMFDADGEEGFKNNVEIFATYTLTNTNILTLQYKATSDGPTPISTTAHSYFNLFGHDYGCIDEHELEIYSNQVLEQREDRLPSGTMLPVEKTEFDFQAITSLKAMVNNRIEINHSYVFNYPKNTKRPLLKMAKLKGDGRVLRVSSNESTLHFYNGHNLDGVEGKSGSVYEKYAGLCLEPKGFVNAINEPTFPCTIIDKLDCYQHTIVYDFSQ